MNERALYPEIERSVERLGGYWKKTTDMHFRDGEGKVAKVGEAVVPKKGDADFAWILPPFGFLVEVKRSEQNFNFKEIKPEQRLLLGEFPQISWLWLSMGYRIGGKQLPRKTWLVSWPCWLALEGKFQGYGLAGIAHSKPHKTEHRELGLSAVEQLSHFELQWNDGAWDIPAAHPFTTNLYTYRAAILRWNMESYD